MAVEQWNEIVRHSAILHGYMSNTACTNIASVL